MPGPVLTKTDAVTDRARRVHGRQTDTCSGRPWCCPSSLSQRHRKRSGQKAQDARKANRCLQRSPFVLPVQLIPEAQEEIWAESSGCTEGKQTPAAVALDAVQSSLSQRRRKRFGRKAQVRMKTQLLACVLNLSELVYDLGSEKTKTPTNSERPQEGQGAH